MRTQSFLQAALLAAAVLVPVVYFGAQLLAAPCFPGYSVVATTASELGSDASSCPGVLNSGAMLAGLLAMAGAIGLAASLPRLGAGRIAALALASCLASAGVAALWAGLHPLPDPAHNPGALGAGMFGMPFVAVWAAWRLPAAKTLRSFLLFDAAAFVVLGAIMAGLTGIDLPAHRGLLQKLVAAACFAPVVVVACVALRRASGRSRTA